MKVQVTLNEELVKRIDEYAAAIGLSRSAVCAMWIGQSALGAVKVLETLDKMGVEVAKTLNDTKTEDKQSGGSSGD